jgi:uncharacterized membrane protein YfhO
VILDDLFYPGWKATVDGRAAPIRAADGMLRAVAVAPGVHLLRFSYQPASTEIGAILTILGLLLAAGTIAAGALSVQSRSAGGRGRARKAR